jgi:DNA-binding XRE family transcriptional regulator
VLPETGKKLARNVNNTLDYSETILSLRDINMANRKKFSGEVLKNLRKQAGYTQDQLAEQVGLSRETVSAIETERPETINALTVKIISRWNDCCNQRIAETDRTTTLYEEIMRVFNF